MTSQTSCKPGRMVELVVYPRRPAELRDGVPAFEWAPTPEQRKMLADGGYIVLYVIEMSRADHG